MILVYIIAAAVAIFGGIIIGTASSVAYFKAVAESKYKTAIKIGKKFYYIVEESEYVNNL